MHFFSEFFVLLLSAAAAAVFFFDPRLKASWSTGTRAAMIGIVALFALSQMLLKGVTGKGIDDRAADIVANAVCRIAVVSDRCPSEVLKRSMEEQAFQDKQESVAILMEKYRSEGVPPLFRCPFEVRYAMLEQGACTPYPCSLVPDMNNGVDGPSGHNVWYYLSDPPYSVTCTSYKMGDKGRKYELPSPLKACSFTKKDFSCW